MGGATKSRTARTRAAVAKQVKHSAKQTGAFSELTDGQVGAFFSGETLSAASKKAVDGYIEIPAPGQFGKGQNLNHALETGARLTANERQMDKGLSAAMHDLGHDAVLYRAAHNDILAAVGLNLSTYQNMSNAQISAALKGGVIESKGYSSTSFNIRDNPFISGSQSGGREVYLHIKAPKNTKVVGGNPAQAECILDKGTKMQITGAHFDGSYAYPRAGGVVKRVIVDVEIIP